MKVKWPNHRTSRGPLFWSLRFACQARCASRGSQLPLRYYPTVAGVTTPPATEGDTAATVLAISHYSRRRLAHLNLGADLLNLRCLVSSRRVRKPICRDSQDGYLPFNLVTFVTALTLLLPCHLTTLNFRMKGRLGSQCAGEHKWRLLF